jgi:hypothetical protein
MSIIITLLTFFLTNLEKPIVEEEMDENLNDDDDDQVLFIISLIGRLDKTNLAKKFERKFTEYTSSLTG